MSAQEDMLSCRKISIRTSRSNSFIEGKESLVESELRAPESHQLVFPGPKVGHRTPGTTEPVKCSEKKQLDQQEFCFLSLTERKI